MATGRTLNRLFERDVYLWPGQEQDFGPFQYYPNGTIRAFSSGIPLHYLGVFDEPEYREFRARGGRAPFLIGTARLGNNVQYDTTGWGRFFVVVRKSGWALGTFPIHVLAEYG